MSNTARRGLPSVDRLVRVVEEQTNGTLPRAEIVQIAREVVDAARRALAEGEPAPSVEELARQTLIVVERLIRPSLRRVINATGVVVQTNLGRAPLSPAALAAIHTVAQGYSNLEYDLDAGERGSRYNHLTAMLARLTGAEAALAVNNNAAAVLLALACFCAGKEVLVSRGQAVEIGGGFRIPDVLRQSGARLVEVGTTNRTYAHDYAAAITPETAAILTVHRSNFRVVGFTHDPHEMEIRHLAHEAGVLWIDDWGSGSLLRPERYGLAAEDTIQDRVAAGCDLVCFSGDKLLGGPQAGLIVGSSSIIGQLRKHPLLRALRVDKLTIAAMEATLLSYVQGRAEQEIPVWQMISASVESLHTRATTIVAQLRERGVSMAEVTGCESAVGGGSLPGATLPSWSVTLATAPDRLHARLRHGDPAVIARIVEDRLLLDLRTVLPHEDMLLVDAVSAALAQESQPS
ncbi:MAG TPA: L-seryl-tRNA(Sec) selenium transferase [Herpetosiphonaceae bacterium]